MSFTIEFKFEAEVEGPGVDKRTYRDALTFDPGVVFEHDAPVALRVAGQYGADDVEYRRAGGGFLRSTGIRADGSDLSLAVMHALAGLGFDKINFGDVRRRGSPPADRTVRSERDATVARLKAILDDAAFVGGVLHVPCEEPYVVRAERDGVVLTTAARYGCAERYRPDERELAERSGHGFPARIEVVDASLLRGDFSHDRLQSAAADFARAVARVAGHLPSASVDDFVTVRSAVGRFGDAAYRADEAVAAARRLDEVVGSLGLRRLTHGYARARDRLELFADDRGASPASDLDLDDDEAFGMIAGM